MKTKHKQARGARTRRKLFPPFDSAESIRAWKSFALKTREQFKYLGLKQPKFGEL